MEKTYVLHITTDDFERLCEVLQETVLDFELVAEFSDEEE
jgi:hypothetical protein